MKRVGFFLKLTQHHAGELLRRRIVIAVVLILCIALPLCIGPAMESMFADGVSFSGMTVAVTAPEGSPAPKMIEEYVGKMRDVNEYCNFQAMDYEEAEILLRDGKITAIVVLPNRFFTGVMTGTNPDVELIVTADHPMESVMIYWLGQSLTDILSAAQAGIYAVLDSYDEQLPDSMTKDDVVLGINMKYIVWTLGRGDMFRIREFSAVQAMPIAMHYGLSLLAYLCLSLAPLFAALYMGSRLTHLRRLRCLGYGSVFHFVSTVAACTVVIFAVAVIPVWLMVRGNVIGTILTVAAFAVFCALFGSLCCLLTTGAANSGLLAFSVALLSLGASGGILPPTLLPETLRKWSALSPVNWLRELVSVSGKDGLMQAQSVIGLVVATALMGVVSGMLYHRRMTGQEVTA